MWFTRRRERLAREEMDKILTKSKVAGAKESASIRALKKEIRILEESSQAMEDQINYWRDQASANKNAGWQDKVIDAAVGLFSPTATPMKQAKVVKTKSLSSQPDEADDGVSLTDAEIQSYLSKMNPTILSALKNYTKEDFKNIVAEKAGAKISDSSLDRAYQILHGEDEKSGEEE